MHACQVLASCLAEARFENVGLLPHSQQWSVVFPKITLRSMAQDTLRESKPPSLSELAAMKRASEASPRSAVDGIVESAMKRMRGRCSMPPPAPGPLNASSPAFPCERCKETHERECQNQQEWLMTIVAEELLEATRQAREAAFMEFEEDRRARTMYHFGADLRRPLVLPSPMPDSWQRFSSIVGA